MTVFRFYVKVKSDTTVKRARLPLEVLSSEQKDVLIEELYELLHRGLPRWNAELDRIMSSSIVPHRIRVVVKV